MRQPTRFSILAGFAVAGSLAGQAVPAVSVHAARILPVGTWRTYLGPAWGAAATVRRGVARLEVAWRGFGPTTVRRPYQGSGTPVAITTSARALTLSGGPAVGIGPRALRVELGVAAGLAHFHNASRAVLPGDPGLVDRSNSFDDVTWTAAGSAEVVVRPWRGRVAFSAGASAVRTGPTRIVREDNLRFGTISGLYIPPIPTAGSWIAVTAGVRVAL